MDLNSFVNRLVLLLLPGIIAYKIYIKLRGKRDKKDWEDLTNILIFALLSYIIYGFLHSLSFSLKPISISCSYQPVEAFNKLIDDKAEINWWEVIWACAISIVLAYIASFIHKKKIFNRLGQGIKVTNHYGDEDVWEYFHNNQKFDWLVVRDHKTNLYYYGNIQVFSDTHEKRELLLYNASVYRSDGEYIYTAVNVYLAREFDDLTIEVPVLEEIRSHDIDSNTNTNTCIEEGSINHE